ncbi:YihY/virulence factor BrkB family protein [Streptacidiphilus sp. ASG 303]|uniref:YhjD/YihY/BrkB family envelope integrity protein n=1 Tax=Streptacidiphilus sp. ASG 303 TaxID=2896847 RepID=UPI001E32760C|nr:YhjD/YihY/BrkB family envelope integrity protein [Streptacidiphilus sp. ASG 303]MCD0480903.1 YihY/virulence factor BrkB family protein [Streptacidiphilus sp. ASG 303]
MRARERAARLRRTVRALWSRIPLLPRVAEQLLRVDVLDNGTRLAAQVFLAALPALLVFSAFAPAPVRDELLSSLRSEFGLRGESLELVKQLLQSPDGVTRETFGVVGAVVTLVSATACSRALQRVCERAWRLPRSGLRIAAWRWPVWLAVWLAVFVLQGPLRNGFGVGPLLGVPLVLLVDVLLWWWTQHLLLGGRVPWRPLLPGAVLCAVSVVVLSGAARLYLPRALDRAVRQFGAYGAVFTLLSWLIVVGAAVTASVSLGYVLASEGTVVRLLAARGREGRADGRTRAGGARTGSGPRRWRWRW